MEVLGTVAWLVNDFVASFEEFLSGQFGFMSKLPASLLKDMKRLGLIAYVAVLLMPSLMSAEEISVLELSKKVADKGMVYVDMGDYKGSVYLQGLVELSLASGDDELMKMTKSLLDDFVSGKRKGRGNFISYFYGGTSAAQMYYRGFDEYASVAKKAADLMWTGQKRNPDGHMVPPWDYIDDKNPVFVDVLLAATPLYLYQGLKENRQEYVDYAVWMLTDVLGILADKSTGLYHQARGVKSLDKGEISQDCWSRGNGWASLAYASLLHDLPSSHPQYRTVRNMARRFFKAVVNHQDADGLWHQEMTMHDSFVEISGSALLLYGLGAAIEAGVLPHSYDKAFRKGLSGIMTYISERGDVGNTCWSCLAEGDCSKKAYASHIYYMNEPHGFGAVLLAFSQALRNGVTSVEADLGSRVAAPACHVKFASERKGDIAWENDLGSFRNGGLGGSAIIDGGTPVSPEPYADYRIYKDGPEELEFEISYQPYKVSKDVICQRKRIRMLLGTAFYQVTETVETESGSSVQLGVGLTDFGAAKVTADKERGLMALQEAIEHHGEMGCAVFADPSRVSGTMSVDGDHFLILDMQSGASVTYYVGAAWEKDVRWTVFNKKWPKTVSRQSWNKLDDFYNRR